MQAGLVTSGQCSVSVTKLTSGVLCLHIAERQQGKKGTLLIPFSPLKGC